MSCWIPFVACWRFCSTSSLFASAMLTFTNRLVRVSPLSPVVARQNFVMNSKPRVERSLKHKPGRYSHSIGRKSRRVQVSSASVRPAHHQTCKGRSRQQQTESKPNATRHKHKPKHPHRIQQRQVPSIPIHLPTPIRAPHSPHPAALVSPRVRRHTARVSPLRVSPLS